MCIALCSRGTGYRTRARSRSSQLARALADVAAQTASMPPCARAARGPIHKPAHRVWPLASEMAGAPTVLPVSLSSPHCAAPRVPLITHTPPTSSDGRPVPWTRTAHTDHATPRNRSVGIRAAAAGAAIRRPRAGAVDAPSDHRAIPTSRLDVVLVVPPHARKDERVRRRCLLALTNAAHPSRK